MLLGPCCSGCGSCFRAGAACALALERFRAGPRQLDLIRFWADIIPVLFRRTLDSHQITFAMGESLAHLAYLSVAGRLRPDEGADGVVRFAPADG